VYLLIGLLESAHVKRVSARLGLSEASDLGGRTIKQVGGDNAPEEVLGAEKHRDATSFAKTYPKQI
jgi:hypothetical protein